MKRISLLLILGVLPLFLFSQSWREAFYFGASSTKGKMNFYEMQKDFNEYWSKYDIKGGYYYVDGKKKKAAGWKQFKRWEWFWETRVDPNTGVFPSIDKTILREDLRKFNSKSDEANWVSVGPSQSDGGYAGIGRINCIAFHPSNENTFWVGAPSGGLWKTIDGGSSWTVLTDNIPVIGVSGIFIPNDYETSKTIYIATGDRDAGDNYSIGILKSVNDGQSWEATGLTFNVSSGTKITRLLVHPTQQNIMYSATNKGIYKTTNSGADWSEIKTGNFSDMEFKYTGEDTVLYAVTSGSPILYKTKNAGISWAAVHSFPASTRRIELDVAQSDPNIVYALAATDGGGMEGVYKSSNGGESFTKIYDGTIAGNNLLNWGIGDSDEGGQGWYDLTLSVSPTDANTLYLGGINSWKSIDGGVNWQCVNMWTTYTGYNTIGAPAVHADKHFMEFQNANTFFEANDGGIYKTSNGGTTWTDLTNTMVISQIYRLSVARTQKDVVITGLQDNGSKLSYDGGWYDVKGGDGMECLIDYADAKVQYATYANGQIDRTTDLWNNSVDISDNIPGGPAGAWVTPYVIDPANNKTLYVGYSDMWKTTDRGNTWSKISSLNLSRKIRSVAIAPSNNKTLYITDQVSFHTTTNGGVSWSNLTSKLPSSSSAITYITVDAYNSQKLWITYGGYTSNKVYESVDGGKTWTNISAGLPSIPVNSIIQNVMSADQHLYVGTDVGVYVKKGTESWTLFNNGLPNVVVNELEIYYDANPVNSVLYSATYGRGLWKSNLASFTVGVQSEGFENSDIKLYPNPSNGMVSVSFAKHYGAVSLMVMDMMGKIVYNEQLAGEGIVDLNLSHLPKGVYLVKMGVNGSEINSKLVIEK
ncbi:MAG: T9SS type A sorting domain-containing protein [Bacteroidales bacterium]|nr:T9SS type A sorting domain-containing protein [Bacteroidales bacterium]